MDPGDETVRTDEAPEFADHEGAVLLGVCPVTPNQSQGHTSSSAAIAGPEDFFVTDGDCRTRTRFDVNISFTSTPWLSDQIAFSVQFDQSVCCCACPDVLSISQA